MWGRRILNKNALPDRPRGKLQNTGASKEELERVSPFLLALAGQKMFF